jgi:hypothetical protein
MTSHSKAQRSSESSESSRHRHAPLAAPAGQPPDMCKLAACEAQEQLRLGLGRGYRGWHGIGLGIEVEIGVGGCAGVGGGEGGRGCRGCLEGVGERSLALLLAKGRVGGKIKERDLLRPALGARKGPSLAPNAG